jgi:hypothetical protein
MPDRALDFDTLFAEHSEAVRERYATRSPSRI